MESIKRTGRKMDAAWRAAISEGKKMSVARNSVKGAMLGTGVGGLIGAASVSNKFAKPVVHMAQRIAKAENGKAARAFLGLATKVALKHHVAPAAAMGALGGAVGSGVTTALVRKKISAPRRKYLMAKQAFKNTK